MFHSRHDRQGWIGIDFGARAIKLAQVERSPRGLRLVAARVLLRPDEEEADCARTAAQWWDEVCSGSSLREGFAGRRAACVLPASRTDLRAMTLPEGTEAERRTMIAGELDGLLGASGPRVFDFWDSRPPEEATESSLETVGVLSVAEDEAAAVAYRVAQAGLRCEVLDGLPPALARAVTLVEPPDEPGAVAAVDWGFETATFCVVYDGRPVFTRQLRDCRFAALPAAVSRALGMSLDDAEQLLAVHGVYDPAKRDDPLREVQEVLVDILAEPIGEIVAQLAKTLAYSELRRSRLAPKRIWLLGGGATVRNIAGFLSGRIGLPVQVWGLPVGAESRMQGFPVLSQVHGVPAAILGPAVALSALEWER